VSGAKTMKEVHQSDRELYHIILLSSDAKKIMLIPSNDGFLLPLIEIPRWQRVAQNLTAEVQTQCGCNAVCLFTSENTGLEEFPKTNHQVMEYCRPATKPKGNSRGEWVQVAALSRQDFVDPQDHVELQRALTRLEDTRSSSSWPFTSLGWFQRLHVWVEDAISPLGLRLNGTFSQLNASRSFALLRFETSGRPVWFKAVGEPNVHEFPITQALTKLFPQYLPQIIATQPAINGWLTLEAKGSSLSDETHLPSWNSAAETLAKLQLDSITETGLLVEAGAPELPCFALSKLIDPFFSVMGQLMEEQAKVPPPLLTRDELLLLAEQIEQAFSSFQNLHLPDALGSLDLNPGNIIVSDSGCVFLDWAEAYVGNPLISFQYLLENFRRTCGQDENAEHKLTRAYVQPWTSVVPQHNLEKALALAPLLAAYTYTVATDTWHDEIRLRTPGAAGHLRSLVRRMSREARRLEAPRPLCTQ